MIGHRELQVPQYQCQVCGHVYDPRIGDPHSGIAPGTSFDSLPEEWICPECGAPKSLYRRIEES